MLGSEYIVVACVFFFVCVCVGGEGLFLDERTDDLKSMEDMQH
jgi:hypothetical protein